eukprot:410375-Prymnesium_polylepis.1
MLQRPSGSLDGLPRCKAWKFKCRGAWRATRTGEHPKGQLSTSGFLEFLDLHGKQRLPMPSKPSAPPEAVSAKSESPKAVSKVRAAVWTMIARKRAEALVDSIDQSKMLKVLSSLDDRLVERLLRGDIRLLRSSWLLRWD